MGKAGLICCKVVDGALFVFFVVVAVVTPLLNSPICLPSHLVPSSSVDFKTWFAQTSHDYLLSEEPHFFVGILSLELFFQWPIALASLYAMAMTKSWFTTTSLIFGVSALSCSAALIWEITLSGRASGEMLVIYYSYLGFVLLALLRGLFAKGEGVVLLHTKKRA